jgi:hypothetical protein
VWLLYEAIAGIYGRFSNEHKQHKVCLFAVGSECVVCGSLVRHAIHTSERIKRVQDLSGHKYRYSRRQSCGSQAVIRGSQSVSTFYSALWLLLRTIFCNRWEKMLYRYFVLLCWRLNSFYWTSLHCSHSLIKHLPPNSGQNQNIRIANDKIFLHQNLPWSFTYWNSLPQFFHYQVVVSITVSSSKGSDILYIWTLSFVYQDMIYLIMLTPSGEVQVCLWMSRCGNVVHLTRFFEVAKCNALIPLSLLASCRLPLPIIGLKMSSLPTFALKPPRKFFIWYLRN